MCVRERGGGLCLSVLSVFSSCLGNRKAHRAEFSQKPNRTCSATLPPGRVVFPSTETTERPQPVLRSGSFPLSTFSPQSQIALNSLRSALVFPQPPRAAEYGRVSSRSYATLPVAQHLHVRAPSRFLKAFPPERLSNWKSSTHIMFFLSRIGLHKEREHGYIAKYRLSTHTINLVEMESSLP